MKIILCAYHWAGCKALEELITNEHEVFVYTHKNPYNVPSLIDYCKKQRIPYSLENISKSQLPFTPDIIISVYYRYLISNDVIMKCNKKIINLHPSLLPKYRGCSSLTWAMINGEKDCGFTYHYIDTNIDTGNILLQEKVKIEDFDTQETLYNRVMFLALKKFTKAIELVSAGYEGIQQVGQVSMYKRACPYNGEISDSWSDDKIDRFIRAMIYPPYPKATYKGRDINSLEEYHTIKSTELNNFEKQKGGGRR